MKEVLKGFKDFIARGNVIELAVGVVIGTAFTALVKAIVDNLVSPLIGIVVRADNLSAGLQFEILGATFRLGAVINAVIVFLATAAAVYFFIVLPLNKLSQLKKAKEAAGEEVPEELPEDVALLKEIRDLLKAQNSNPTGE